MRKDYLTSVAIGLALVALGARLEARTIETPFLPRAEAAPFAPTMPGMLRLAEADDTGASDTDASDTGASDTGADDSGANDGETSAGDGSDGNADDGAESDPGDGGPDDGAGDPGDGGGDEGGGMEDGTVETGDPGDNGAGDGSVDDGALDPGGDVVIDDPDGPTVPDYPSYPGPDVVIDDPLPGIPVDVSLPTDAEIHTMTGGDAQPDVSATSSSPVRGDSRNGHQNAAADWGRDGCKSFFDRGKCD